MASRRFLFGVRFAFPVVAALLVAPRGAAAQAGGLTVDEAVRVGLARNPQVGAARAGMLSARANYRSLAALPPVTLSAAQQQGKATDPDSTLDFGEVLDLSGQRRYGAAAANAQYRTAFFDLQETKLSLEQQIRDAYWTLAAAQSQTRIAEVGLHEAQRVYDLTVKQLDAGTSPRSDVVRSSIDVANAKQTLLAEQNGKKTAQITLNTLLAQPPTTPIELAADLTGDGTPAPASLPGSLDELSKQALANRPLLKSIAAQALAARYGVKQAEASRFPDMTVDFQRSLQHTNDGFFLGLSFPLIDFGSVRESIRAAKELSKQADAVRAQTEQEVARQVAQAYADLDTAIQSAVDYKKEILDPSVTLLAMAQLGYQQGATGILPVIDAEATIRNARVGYIGSLLSIYKAQNELLAALGPATPAPTTPTSAKNP